MFGDVRIPYLMCDYEREPTLIKPFIEELLLSTKREGIEDLIQYMNEGDYFTAPCSSNHHLNIKFGLSIHSLRAYSEFQRKMKFCPGLIPNDSVIIIPLLHDVCKMGLYEMKIMENVNYKNRPVITTRKDAERGHAAVSIARCEQFIKLTPIETDCIKFHMGLFHAKEFFEHGEFTVEEMHKAIKRNAAVQIFASTDMEVSRWK